MICFEIYKYAKRNRLQDPNVMARLGFFYGGYHISQWWFELCDMVHKLSVTSLIFFLPYDSGLQMKFAILLLGTYMGMLFLINPYIRKTDDQLHLLAQNWLLLLVLSGEIFTVNRDPDATIQAIMTITLIGGFLGFLTCFILMIVVVTLKMMKTSKTAKRIMSCCGKRGELFFMDEKDKTDPTHDIFYQQDKPMTLYETIMDSTARHTVKAYEVILDSLAMDKNLFTNGNDAGAGTGVYGTKGDVGGEEEETDDAAEHSDVAEDIETNA